MQFEQLKPGSSRAGKWFFESGCRQTHGIHLGPARDLRAFCFALGSGRDARVQRDASGRAKVGSNPTPGTSFIAYTRRGTLRHSRHVQQWSGKRLRLRGSNAMGEGRHLAMTPPPLFHQGDIPHGDSTFSFTNSRSKTVRGTRGPH